MAYKPDGGKFINKRERMLNELVKYINQESFEEEFPRYTGDCHPPVKKVIFSDDLIDFISQKLDDWK